VVSVDQTISGIVDVHIVNSGMQSTQTEFAKKLVEKKQKAIKHH